jgi:hypothetical protein
MTVQTADTEAMATALRAAYDDLLNAASTVAGAPPDPKAATTEWNAEQILAHLVLVNAATISAACSAASGAIATYDNRLAQDTWTIERVISRAGGSEGLRDRIRRQADALLVIVPGLSEAELNTPFPTLLLSNDSLLVDDRVPLQSLLEGLEHTELPGHAAQLRALPQRSSEFA